MRLRLRPCVRLVRLRVLLVHGLAPTFALDPRFSRHLFPFLTPPFSPPCRMQGVGQEVEDERRVAIARGAWYQDVQHGRGDQQGRHHRWDLLQSIPRVR